MAASKGKTGESARADRELTLKAAAEVTGVSGKVLRRYIRDGRLRPASMDGNRLTVTVSALREAGLVDADASAEDFESVAADVAEDDTDAAEAEAEAAREREAKERAEREGKERAEREAKERAEREAKERAEREAKERAEREAKERAEREAKERAEREAKDRTAKERAERESKERAAKERAEREAKERAEREAKERAEREAKERAEREAKERAAKERAERDARELAELEAMEREEKAAKERAAREAKERAAKEASKAPPLRGPQPGDIDVAALDDDDIHDAESGDATVRMQPDDGGRATEAHVVTEVRAEPVTAERGMVVAGAGPWVTSNQLADLMRLLAAEREARAQEWMDRTETLYREMLDAQKARVASLEDEKRELQARLEESLRMVPKGENIMAFEQSIRDLRIELDRKEAARTDLEHERDRLRDLTDRLRNDLSRAEKRNLEMAEQLRRFRAQGLLDRLVGREPDDR